MNLADVIAETLSIELTPVKDGSGRARGEGTREGWINGLSMARIHDRLDRYPAILEAVAMPAPLTDLVQVMVNRLEGGHALLAHRDGPPDHYRYHLPVITNPDVTWWDEDNGEIHMVEGNWYGPVSYCGKLHSMINKGATARIHIVADFRKE